MHRALCLAACSGLLLLIGLPLPAAAPPASSSGRASLAERARSILQTHCAACHDGPANAKGGFGFVLDRERLIAAGQVVPGKSGQSPLLERIVQGEMPPGKRPKPTPADLDALRAWIDAGAPGTGTVAPAPVGEVAVLRLIRADLGAMPPRQRRFARYLTLHHLAWLSADHLETHRHALTKLVNSLSWHPRLTRPHALDAARTVYRLDLRHYKWPARAWDRLASAYPYRLPETGATAAVIARLTTCEQPLLRADWFVATASRPPAYHDFLQLPSTDRALERTLQVDVLANLEDDNVARAGFNGSGVAKANRLLERHDGAHGAYWRSYDFSENTGRQNLFERPLGPAPGPHGFQQAGGEAIFNLPNGLQGYLLFDGDGRRVDKAPGEIVSDPHRPDRRVENGLSCISCHVRGILPKDDQVRAHVLKNAGAFDQASRDAVRAQYPPPARMRALMKADADRFCRSLTALGVPLGDNEPVVGVVLRYEDALDLRAVAAAIGAPPAGLTAHLRATPDLARSLGPLLSGGTVQRQVFEEAFPALARGLRLGVDEGAPAALALGAAFRGHRGAVRALAFAPAGKFAVSGGEDGSVRVWDVTTGQERHRFTGHTDEVTAVAFTPDGRRVLSGGRDRSVRLWDLATGREVHRLIGHTDGVRAVAVAPNGKVALSGGEDRALRLWDLTSGTELRALGGHSGPVTAAAFAPDGKRALSGGHDRALRLWEIPSGRLLGRWEGHTATVYALAFGRDGRQALSGGADRSARLWDVRAGRALVAFTGHANSVVAVGFTADGRGAVSGSTRYDTPDRPLRRWGLATGREWPGPASGPERAEAVAFTPDGAHALVSHSDGVLRLWALRP